MAQTVVNAAGQICGALDRSWPTTLLKRLLPCCTCSSFLGQPPTGSYAANNKTPMMWRGVGTAGFEARLAPFQVDDDPGHQGPHRRRPGRSAHTHGARAGAVLHQKERSQ